MKLKYTVEGNGAGTLPFKAVGEVDGGSPVDPQALFAAAAAAFEQITQGKATFGRPGEGGCRGPYRIHRFILEAMV